MTINSHSPRSETAMRGQTDNFDIARTAITQAQDMARRAIAEKDRSIRDQAAANAALLFQVEAAEVVIARLTDATQAHAQSLIQQELVEMGVTQ